MKRLSLRIKKFRDKRKTYKARTLKVITRSNKLGEAFHLPKILNLNPRSALNKIEEIKTFIQEEEIDIAFISESHDRENKKLDENMNLENHDVISNIYQRSTKVPGGRPAIIANKKKYQIQNLTNTVVNIPWGVEMTWALLTPKDVSNNSIVQHIVLGAIYVRPKKPNKTLVYDHIAEVYNVLNARYGKGLFWCIAGDTNKLKLGPILSLDSNLKSVVTKPTRINEKNPQKSTTLDNIITDLHKWYQEPEILPPIAADPGKGKPSDHLTVVYTPLNPLNNKPNRRVRKIVVRPMPESGLNLLRLWIDSQTWEDIEKAPTPNHKAKLLHEILMKKINELLPLKTIKISSDDQPWCSEEIKKIKRLKAREFKKHRMSTKWKALEDRYRISITQAKKLYYLNMVKDLKKSKPGQWYSKLKRMCSEDQQKSEQIVVEEIMHLSDQEQADAIAERMAKISQEYPPLNKCDIQIPDFETTSIPQFSQLEVKKKLKQTKTNKAVPPGDIPPQIIKMFADQLSIPLTDVINSSVTCGLWPDTWKIESVTPVPKVFPPKLIKNLRNISGLVTFNKVEEQLIGKLIMSDMKESLDPAQYANQHAISLQHYLINMIHKILSDTESKSTEATAVLATMFDWQDAFPRQCPKLGIEAFIRCGVRPSLIPVLINYFQNRKMVVKWHNKCSHEQQLNGGGPQGSIFGNLEYLAQSNNNSDCVECNNRFKFVDDLTILEKINILVVGMASHNLHSQVPNDISTDNQIIPPEHLKTQTHINTIQTWTEKQKMILNESKTKAMIFNFTKKHQFTSRLQLKGKNVEIVTQTKLLGTIITNDLKWHANTKHIVKKAWARMQLLRKVSTFVMSVKEKLDIYKKFVRSHLEQSCTVWSSSLSKGNEKDIERVQKSALKLILAKKYTTYQEALKELNIKTLKARRKLLCAKFALKSLRNTKTKGMFNLSIKKHTMKLRKKEKFSVTKAKTTRLKKSAIPYMEKVLNKHFSDQEKEKNTLDY